MSADRRALLAILLVSGSLGAALGLLFPTQHVAIEPAQLWAGLVTYPADNPFGLYERRLWNLWHQILAPLLAAGVSERALCFAVSAAVGVLSFAALSAFSFACGAPLVAAVAAPLFLWILNPVGWGFRYPILLLGHPHTYGMAGLAWIVLATSALGAGRLASGAFLLGMAPAVHASLGAWAALITGLCLLADWRRVQPRLGSLLRGGLLGVGLAIVSLAWHEGLQTQGPDVDPAEVRRHLDAFLAHWDLHRTDAPLLAWNGLLVAIGVAIALLLLRARDRDDASPRALGATLLLRVYVACAGFGLAFVLLARFAPPGAIPHAILAAMPTRLLNFAMVAFVPLVVGALTRHRDDPLARAIFLALGGVAVLWYRAHWLSTWGLPLIGVATAALVARGPRAARVLAPAWRIAERAAGIALIVGVVVTLGIAARGFPNRLAKLRDFTNDPVLEEVAKGEGLLLVAPGISMPQLATRRPLLLDPNAIDMLPYAPDGGPAVARIVTEVYGIDFFDPPEKARNKSVVGAEVVKPIWEARSAAEWSALGARFGFHEVLVPPQWRLALEPAVTSKSLVLYPLPAALSH